MAAAAQARLSDRRSAHADWSKIAALVLAPGVPLTHPAPHWTVGLARAAGVEVIGDIELFCRERRRHAPQAPFVAITGTNGKSTTTALIAHLLRAAGHDVQLGGNIGTAILSLEPPRAGRVHVIEMSSYQIDLAPTLDPSVGILLNVSEDHLDRHGTLRNYAAIKERLVARRPARRHRDHRGRRQLVPRAAPIASSAPASGCVRVSVRSRSPTGLYVEGDADHRRRAGGDRAHDREPARHRLAARRPQCPECRLRRRRGARARAGAGRDPGRAARRFPASRTAWRQVGRKGSVLFVNDSKATNADSAAQALACFSDIFWIAGGKPKTGGISSLAGFFPRIRKAYLIGEAADGFRGRRSKAQVPFVVAGTLDRAVALAARDAEAADVTASRSCCCRRPAPRSTSSAISRCAATSSANWSGRCPASRPRQGPDRHLSALVLRNRNFFLTAGQP